MKDVVLSMIIDVARCCLFFAIVTLVIIVGVLFLKHIFPDAGWIISLILFVFMVIFGGEYLLKNKI